MQSSIIAEDSKSEAAQTAVSSVAPKDVLRIWLSLADTAASSVEQLHKVLHVCFILHDETAATQVLQRLCQSTVFSATTTKRMVEASCNFGWTHLRLLSKQQCAEWHKTKSVDQVFRTLGLVLTTARRILDSSSVESFDPEISPASVRHVQPAEVEAEAHAWIAMVKELIADTVTMLQTLPPDAPKDKSYGWYASSRDAAWRAANRRETAPSFIVAMCKILTSPDVDRRDLLLPFITHVMSMPHRYKLGKVLRVKRIYEVTLPFLSTPVLIAPLARRLLVVCATLQLHTVPTPPDYDGKRDKVVNTVVALLSTLMQQGQQEVVTLVTEWWRSTALDPSAVFKSSLPLALLSAMVKSSTEAVRAQVLPILPSLRHSLHHHCSVSAKLQSYSVRHDPQVPTRILETCKYLGELDMMCAEGPRDLRDEESKGATSMQESFLKYLMASGDHDRGDKHRLDHEMSRIFCSTLLKCAAMVPVSHVPLIQSIIQWVLNTESQETSVPMPLICFELQTLANRLSMGQVSSVITASAEYAMNRPIASGKYDWFISMAFELSECKKITTLPERSFPYERNKVPLPIPVTDLNLVHALVDIIVHALSRDAEVPVVPSVPPKQEQPCLTNLPCLQLTRMLAQLSRIELLLRWCECIATNPSLYRLKVAVAVADELHDPTYGQEVRRASVPLLSELIKRLTSPRSLLGEDQIEAVLGCWAQTHKLTCPCSNCRAIAQFFESPSSRSMHSSMQFRDFCAHFKGKTLTSDIVDPCPTINNLGHYFSITKSDLLVRQHLARVYQARIDSASAPTVVSSAVSAFPPLGVTDGASSAAPPAQLGTRANSATAEAGAPQQ